MRFYQADELKEKAAKAKNITNERSARKLLKEAASITKDHKVFDIFLSHSYMDSQIIAGLKADLEEKGFKVYVDWEVDSELDRENVTEENANIIRKRMGQCKSLIYAVSDNTRESIWMPWELGIFDGAEKKVAILPIEDRMDYEEILDQQEYLGLYPYIEQTLIDNLKVNLYGESTRFFKNWT